MRAGWWPWVRRYSARASLSSFRASASVEVGPAVGLGDLRGAAADDDAVAALVEDLGDGGVQFLAVGGAVEADADVAGGQVGAVAGHPPGRAAGLVVQRGVQVPRPGGLVLERARVVAPCAVPSQVSRRMICSGHARPRAWALSRSWKSRPISLSSRSSASLSSPSRGPGGMVVVLADLLGPGAEDDAAASGFGERPGRVGVQAGGLGDGGLHVGLGELAELAVGDLADQRVVEDKLGAEARVRAEAREGLVQVLLAGLGLFRLDRGPAPLQPAAQAVDGLRRADEADGDGVGRGRGVRVGRAVHGDAVARVDVPVPGAELQLRLVAGRAPS